MCSTRNRKVSRASHLGCCRLRPLGVIILVGIALTVGSIVGLLSALTFDWVRGRALRAAEKRELERTGLEATVLRFRPRSLQGIRDGVPIHIIVNMSRPLPGKVSQTDVDEPSGTFLSVPSAGLDVLICRRDLTDQILGPMTSLPRYRTGEAGFDATFEVFATDPSFDARVFPPPHVRPALAVLGLQWMRRKDGVVETLLGTLSPKQMTSVTEVGLALARPIAAGEVRASAPHYRGASPTPSPIAVEPDDPSDVDTYSPPLLSIPLVIACIPAFFFAVMGGALLPLWPPAHEGLAHLACDPGERVLATRSEAPDGTYHGVACVAEGQPNAPYRETNFALNLACGTTAASAPLSIGLLFTLVRFFRAGRRFLPTSPAKLR